MEVNAEQRKRFMRKVEEALWGGERQNCRRARTSAFKPHTDDIREAPSLEILQWLEKHGAKIRAFDPVAAENVRKIFPNVTYCDTPYRHRGESGYLC